MSKRLPVSIEFVTLLYFLSYVPNILVTKLITSLPRESLGRPLTGLETMPVSLIISAMVTYIFVWLAGWHKHANSIRIAGLRLPFPTRATFASGIGTAFVLFTVPLSFTFPGVSIPFIQVLMRGDILIIAPITDLMFGRRVRWWSWMGLVLVSGAFTLTIHERGGLKMQPLAILTVILYTLGYFVRLVVMNKVSKTGDRKSVRRYFVEEKIVALPFAVMMLGVLSASGIGRQSGELYRGFVHVWTDPILWALVFLGVSLFAISIFSIIILLDARENSYCVPFERSASLIAGVGAAFLLHRFWRLDEPTGAEIAGAALVIAAIVLLSLAPRYDKLMKKRVIAEKR